MKTFHLLGLALAFFFLSCKKEGCTDANAANYDGEANTDNNSCEYKGDVSFWFDQGVSDQLINWYSVTELNIYINNSLAGTVSSSDWSVGPDCGGANFTTSWEMGKTDEFTFNYYANDQTGGQQFSGTGTMLDNDCTSIELKW